jgi:hypothetical protein
LQEFFCTRKDIPAIDNAMGKQKKRRLNIAHAGRTKKASNC